MNFCHMKIIYTFHLRYYPNIIGHILGNKQKNNCVCIHDIIRFIIMKMKMQMKNRSHRYDINRLTIPDKIFGTKCINLVKLDKKIKVWYLFLRVFLDVIGKVEVLQGRLGTRLCPPKFEIFLIFPTFLKSATREANRIPSLLH